MLEMVKYQNDLNTIPLRKFNEPEMNVFMAVIQQMRDNGLRKIDISYDKLKDLSNWKTRKQTDRAFVKYLESISRKLMQLSGTKWSPDGLSFDSFVLFTRFSASNKDQKLTVSVNPDFEYILNDFTGGSFTQYELAEFVALSTTYAKGLYRLLKQFRTTGYAKIQIDKFRELLSVPKSYQIADIDKHVFTKAARIDLANCFSNLVITKVHGKTRGNPVVAYVFRFDKEKPDKDEKRIEFDKKIFGDDYDDTISKDWDFRANIQ